MTPPPLASAPLVLTRFPQTHYANRIGAIFALVLAIVFIGILTQVPTEQLQARLNDPHLARKTFAFFATLLLSGGVGWLLWQVQRHEQLILDQQGIEYRPPFSWWRSPPFRVRWADIERIELIPPRRRYELNLTELNVITARRQYRLRPLQWFPRIISWKQFINRHHWREQNAWTRFEQSVVGQQFAARGLTVELATATTPGFDLFSNTASKIAVIGLLSLLGYSFIDTLALEQRYLAYRPVYVMLIIGVVSAAAILPLLWRNRVPAVERVGVSLLFGCAAGIASYAGMLRLNQWTDWDGSETVLYTREADGRFVADGYPTIAEDPLEPFWEQLPAGQPYSFQLYRGALGFWQLDEKPVNDAMRAFYLARDSE